MDQPSGAAAFAALEAIQSGQWDRFLTRLQAALSARMRTPEWQHHIVAGDTTTVTMTDPPD